MVAPSYWGAERFSSRFCRAIFSNFNVAKSTARVLPAQRPPTTTEYQADVGFMVLRRNPRYRMAAAHTHSSIELNFLQTGRLVYLHGGVRRTIAAGRLALFWAGVPHQTISTGELANGIWVQLPLAWVLQWKLPRDASSRLLAGEFFQLPYDPELPERWLRYHNSGEADQRAVLLLELHAMLARVALELPPGPAAEAGARNTAATSGGDEHISRVTAFIARHYHEDELALDDIARVVNLRPHYLTTLFKRHCHVGLWEYVTRLRISHAQRLLVTTDLRVLDVAMESGFSSLAPFYNAFTRYCGMRPLAFRKRRGEPAGPE